MLKELKVLLQQERKALKVQPGHKGLQMDHKVPREQQEVKVIKGCKVLLEQAHKAPKVLQHQAIKAPKEYRVRLDQAHKAHKVV